MPDGMKTYKLKNLASVQTGPFGSQLHQKDYVKNGTPILTVEHLGENRILHNDLPCISEQDRERLKKYSLLEGDIVFSRVGSVDRRAYVRKEEEGWLFSGRCLRIRPDCELVDGKYLSYYFGLEAFKKYIRGIAVGATMPSLNTNILNEIVLQIPPLETQSRIASILSSLDDKIELNLQMNKTLEAIAQAIFKEWFVDFRFPGFDGELVDGLPKGWGKGKISDIAVVTDCLHSKKPEKVKEETGFILLQLENIVDGGILDLSNKYYISEADYKKWISRIEISTGDCIITNVGRVGAVARIPKNIKAALGRNMTGIRLRDGFPFPTFLIELLLSDIINVEVSKKKDVGTILEALNVKNIPLLEFSLPDYSVLMAFEKLVSPIRNRIELNQAENFNLSKMRDTLLPKLMSGKIRVP